jgi:hypothetical protein
MRLVHYTEYYFAIRGIVGGYFGPKASKYGICGSSLPNNLAIYSIINTVT